MAGPLSGFTVVDLTRVLSGPYCTMILADLGARVIKVEQPGKGDDTRHWGPPFLGAESAYFLSINRNKESVTVDFKPAEGREVLERLIARADVFVENFRPGTIERAGFGWDAVHAKFPKLVYASISGYGQTGQRVDIGMLDTTAALLTYQAANWFATSRIPERQGNRHATIAPYETFTTKDGEIVIAVGNDGIWKRFCHAMGLEELAADPRFTSNKDRMEHYDSMRPPIDRVFRTKTCAEWIAILNAAGVANGEVRNIGQMLNDPQLEAREMVRTLMHPTVGATRVIGAPIKLSETEASVRTPPPVLGQHTDAVLSEIGYDSATIAALRQMGVV
jgi:crotonobetainyl-CoA:carnitine CoA-transferase CaiB-like acyl-CoA transferase